MTQRNLPLWASDDFTTYSELETIRTTEFNRRGPGLLRDLRDRIDVYDETGDVACLGDLNDLSVKLSTLSPHWLDFSVEVLRVMLSPASNSPRHLRNEFESTLKRLAA